MVGVSLGSAVSESAIVGEGDRVSVGRGGGVEGEQEERRKRKDARRTRAAMGLDMGGILTD